MRELPRRRIRSWTKGLFVSYQSATREMIDLVAPISTYKKAPGHAYGQDWASIPFPRMPNVSLQPAARNISEDEVDRGNGPRHLHRGRRLVLDRSAAIQLPVRRADVLGNQERQEDAAAARRRVCRPHARLLELDVDDRRSSDLRAGRGAVGRQGAADAAQLRVARVSGGAVSERQRHSHCLRVGATR